MLIFNKRLSLRFFSRFVVLKFSKKLFENDLVDEDVLLLRVVLLLRRKFEVRPDFPDFCRIRLLDDGLGFEALFDGDVLLEQSLERRASALRVNVARNF